MIHLFPVPQRPPALGHQHPAAQRTMPTLPHIKYPLDPLPIQMLLNLVGAGRIKVLRNKQNGHRVSPLSAGLFSLGAPGSLYLL
jgi:hypothetical protein